MCLRGPPPPVFIDVGGAQTFFLDDLFGRTLADAIRALVGYPPLHSTAADPGFFASCPSRDPSYLASSFSSLWAFAIPLLAFAAGLVFPLRKRLALALLGGGVLVSLLDTGIRLAGELGSARGERRDLLLHGLPGQLIANACFQLLLPCLAGFAFMRLALLARRLLPRRPDARS